MTGQTGFALLEATRDGFTISTDRQRLDTAAVHSYLTRSYWAEGISAALVAKSIRGSLCFGLYDASAEQVGFARVVSDGATFAYLCDVYVLESVRGCGLGIWLMETVMQHPDLAGLRRSMLVTRDAHGLYARFGFTPSKFPDRIMEIARPGLYKETSST
jgi:GNAT superfamily N-acetyltransferase